MNRQIVSLDGADANAGKNSDRADGSWGVSVDGTITAHCSVWWNATPCYQGQITGVMGHYRAADENSADVLIQHVLSQLRSNGCSFVIGPMNQNTWRDYRFVIQSDDRPPFFFEPSHFSRGPAQFRRNGFNEIATYFSAIVDDLTVQTKRIIRIRDRFTKRGVRIRTLEKCRFVDELKQIHSVAKLAFREHFLFDSVSEEDFIDMYRPLENKIPSSMILLAEQASRVVGFCFAAPDLLQATRGEPVDTIIVKTFGVLPEHQYAGLGQLMLEEVQFRASQAGFRQGIHALVEEGGSVARISSRYAIPFRRYALFGKELSQ